MPCYDDPANYRQQNTYTLDVMREDRRKFEAALCATMQVLEAEGLMNLPDWQEAGVERRWVEEWWTAHKETDRLRKLQEAAAWRKQQVRNAALAKLTKEEKEALGLK